MPRRNRYQFGSLELRKRTKGPDVWLFRYWDRQNPSATRPSITLGTVEDYPTRADARRAAEGLRLEINHGLPLREAVTFQGLIDRYVSEEIERGDLAHTTKEPDLNRINKHISPKWGSHLLREVKPYPVQDWLRQLPMAPKTRGHIRSLMYRLFGQQAFKTSSHFDRRGVWSPARSTGPSLSLYGSFGGLHWPSYQRGDGPALESDRLRKPGHGNQRRFCSQPGDEAQVRVLPGPIASGPGRCDHFARMEAIVSGYRRKLGFSQPTDKQTLRFWLAAEKGAQGRCFTSQDSGTDRLAHVSAQLSRLARRNRCSPRRTAETDASCQHLDHDERVRRSLHGIEAQSQHIRCAARVGSRPHQIAKGRHVDGLCSGAPIRIGPFQTTIENPDSS